MAKVVTSGFDLVNRDLVEMARRVDKAKDAALRSAANEVAKVAQSHAPVYSGDRADVVKGQLKKSVKPWKVKRTAGLSQITVGAKFPGWLYSGEEEARQPFIGPARSVAETALAAAIEVELTKGLRGLL